MAQVQLTTDVKSFSIASIAAVTTTTPSRVVTTTKPVAGSGSVLVGSSLNYLKFKTLSTSTSALTMTFIGWSFYPDQMAWVPQTLCVATTVLNTNAQAAFPGLAGTNYYEVSQYTKTVGDAKIFNSTNSTTNGAFILIDTVGCQFIEVHCSAASGIPTVQVLHGGL
jgi:hypothetical protein